MSALGPNSRRFSYGSPDVIIRVSLPGSSSSRFISMLSASLANTWILSAILCWALYVCGGSMQYFSWSASKPLIGTSILSLSSTALLLWHNLLVILSIIGIWYFSLISKPNFAKSLASWLQEGSSIAILANFPITRLSCSF